LALWNSRFDSSMLWMWASCVILPSLSVACRDPVMPFEVVFDFSTSAFRRNSSIWASVSVSAVTGAATCAGACGCAESADVP
jgi:hypothetical protein